MLDNERIIDAKELKTIIPYSSMHVWRLEKEGKFPKRIPIGTNRVGWSLNEVHQWIEIKKDQRLISK